MRYLCWLAPETSNVIKWGLVFVLQKYTYFSKQPNKMEYFFT